MKYMRKLPGLSSWVECCYNTDSQQGNSLGSLCFAIALQPIVERTKREVLNLLCSAWYLDDGTLCGTPQDLNVALRIMEEEGPPEGVVSESSQVSPLHFPWG